MKGNAIVISILLLLSSVTPLAASLRVGDLRVEALENPVGIDSRNPRFSWRYFCRGRAERHAARLSHCGCFNP